MVEREVRELLEEHAGPLSHLLREQRPEYVAHFHPFAFEEESIAQMLRLARRDWFRSLYWEGQLAGFFMMRGFDEGYTRPAFGVFVAEPFAGRGLARLALEESLKLGKQRGCQSMMLKVARENTRAHALYAGHGFVEIGTCEGTDQILMEYSFV